jgi:hypothetical protein
MNITTQITIRIGTRAALSRHLRNGQRKPEEIVSRDSEPESSNKV